MIFIAKNAHAKITLFCHVVGKASDLHMLQSCSVFVDLYDEVFFKKDSTKEARISFVGYQSDLIEKTNTVNDGIKLLSKESGINICGDFLIKKNIPISSGMGGSSASACAAMLAACDAYNIDRSIAVKVAPFIGNDVSLYIEHDNIMHSNISNMGIIFNEDSSITPVKFNENLFFVVVSMVFAKEEKLLNTKSVFECFVEKKSSFEEKLSFSESLDTDLKKIKNFRVNSLQDCACFIMPCLKTVLEHLNDLDGCYFARMSGAGSSCYALFKDEYKCIRAYLHLSSKYEGNKNYKVTLCKCI